MKTVLFLMALLVATPSICSAESIYDGYGVECRGKLVTKLFTRYVGVAAHIKTDGNVGSRFAFYNPVYESGNDFANVAYTDGYAIVGLENEKSSITDNAEVEGYKIQDLKRVLSETGNYRQTGLTKRSSTNILLPTGISVPAKCRPVQFVHVGKSYFHIGWGMNNGWGRD